MRVEESSIAGLVVVTLKQVTDDRGTVREIFRATSYSDGPFSGLGAWRQINVTESRQGGVRGFHGESMVKLVSCVAGEAFGAYLDARRDSRSFGALVQIRLVPGRQVLVPAGVCNAFQSVSSGGCQYAYCFTQEWAPGMPGIAFTPVDDGLAINWPIPIDQHDVTQISAQDVAAPKFSQWRST